MSYEAWGEPDEDDRWDLAIEAGWIDPDNLSKAELDVMAERARQIEEEHFDFAHDDAHRDGALAKAGVCYATQSAAAATLAAEGIGKTAIDVWARRAAVPEFWPWDPQWWKPGEQRRNLVKAAALLIAEIERLDRAAQAADRRPGDFSPAPSGAPAAREDRT